MVTKVTRKLSADARAVVERAKGRPPILRACRSRSVAASLPSTGNFCTRTITTAKGVSPRSNSLAWRRELCGRGPAASGEPRCCARPVGRTKLERRTSVHASRPSSGTLPHRRAKPSGGPSRAPAVRRDGCSVPSPGCDSQQTDAGMSSRDPRVQSTRRETVCAEAARACRETRTRRLFTWSFFQHAHTQVRPKEAKSFRARAPTV